MDAHEQIKQYLDVVWRRKWWIIVPGVLGLAGALYLARTLPKVYRASTTILAIRQSVPSDIAPATISMQPEERIKSLKIQVFSRQYLEKVARQFGLIKPNASEATVERVCRRLAKNQVDIEWDRQSLAWFKIIVSDGDPKRAAEIANRLADLFIEQNTKLRHQAAEGLQEFTTENREKKQRELRERDAKIRKFKEEHLYELPDQQGATIQLLNSVQSRITQLTSEIELRRQRLATLEADAAARRAAAADGAATQVSGDPNTATLARLERELHDLLINYTEENPLVKKKRERIAQFKALHPELSAARSSDKSADAFTSPEIQQVRDEIAARTADRDLEQKRADKLQKSLEDMPRVQQQLTDLTRDYDTLKKQYDSAVDKEDQAERAKELEVAKKGEQFQVQDYARPPAVPYKPEVMRLLIVGLLAGLGLGAGMAVVLEFLDHTMKNEEEFSREYPEVPVLGAIPNLDMDTRRRTKHRHHRAQRPGVDSVARLILIVVASSAVGGMLGGLLG